MGESKVPKIVQRPSETIMRLKQAIAASRTTVMGPDERAYFKDLEAVVDYMSALERMISVSVRHAPGEFAGELPCINIHLVREDGAVSITHKAHIGADVLRSLLPSAWPELAKARAADLVTESGLK